MIKALIDISLVWILVYGVLKNLKNNVKMVMLLKGALIIIIVKALSDYLNLTTMLYRKIFNVLNTQLLI